MRIIILLLSLLPLTLIGQFMGGNNDGSDISQLIQTSIDGQILSVSPLYQGSNGDGHTAFLVTTSISNVDYSVIYQGGTGDGFQSQIINTVLSGEDITSLFYGGSGDGHNVLFLSTTISGTNTEFLYAGGVGDGHDAIMYTGLLNNSSLEGLYSGGIGDGHDISVVQSNLFGQDLGSLYLGGNGDGSTQNLIQGILFGAVLPIEWISFDAQKSESYVLLQWQVISYGGHDYFTIEHSEDGQGFHSIANNDQALELNELSVLSHLHKTPFKGNNYYRIKQVDLDGKQNYTTIKSVFFRNAKPEISIYPNPNSDRLLNIQLDHLLSESISAINVYDVKGSLLKSVSMPSTLRLELPWEWAPGTYWIEFITPDRSINKKLIIVD